MTDLRLSGSGLVAFGGSFAPQFDDTDSKEGDTTDPLPTDSREPNERSVDFRESQLRLSLSGSLSGSFNMQRLSASQDEPYVSIVDDRVLRDQGLLSALLRTLRGVDAADVIANDIIRSLVTWIHDRRPNRSGTSFKESKILKDNIEASLEMTAAEVAEKIRDLVVAFKVPDENHSEVFSVLASYVVKKPAQRESVMSRLNGQARSEFRSSADDVEVTEERISELNRSFISRNDSQDPFEVEADDEGDYEQVDEAGNFSDDGLFFGDLDDD